MKPPVSLNFRRVLLPALLCLCANVSAHPGLWQVKSGDSTVYLFGTVHLLPDDTNWRFPELEKALTQSQTLYIELTDDDPANMTTLVMANGLDPQHPLSTLLSSSENAALESAAQAAGIPGGATSLQPMKPWLAALTLSVAPLEKAGLDPQHGVDKQLKTQMNDAGKSVLGLETAEQQIQFLADMSPSLQIAFLRDTIRDSDQIASELKSLIDAWRNDDTAAIARVENTELAEREPALYQRLIVERNAAWAAHIKALLGKPGTTFIAVGAAHLAGPDSVQAQLQKLGFTVQTD